MGILIRRQFPPAGGKLEMAFDMKKSHLFDGVTEKIIV